MIDNEQTYVLTYGDVVVTLDMSMKTPSVTGIPLGVLLKADIRVAEGIRPELFIAEQVVVAAGTTTSTTKNRHVCVAKLSDIDTYPANAPSEDDMDLPPFFRVSTMEIIIDNPAVAVAGWNDIVADLTQLIRQYSDIGLTP